MPVIDAECNIISGGGEAVALAAFFQKIHN